MPLMPGCRDDVRAGPFGQLYGECADVARSSMDQYCLTSHHVAILEQHLPGGDGDNWSRSGFR